MGVTKSVRSMPNEPRRSQPSEALVVLGPTLRAKRSMPNEPRRSQPGEALVVLGPTLRANQGGIFPVHPSLPRRRVTRVEVMRLNHLCARRRWRSAPRRKHDERLGGRAVTIASSIAGMKPCIAALGSGEEPERFTEDRLGG